MAIKKKVAKTVAKKHHDPVTAFLTDPLISTALIVFALIALVLVLIEFGEAIAY